MVTEDIQAFVRFAGELSQHHGADPIPTDPHGLLNITRFRRTLAWFIRRRPRGPVALLAYCADLKQQVTLYASVIQMLATERATGTQVRRVTDIAPRRIAPRQVDGEAERMRRDDVHCSREWSGPGGLIRALPGPQLGYMA